MIFQDIIFQFFTIWDGIESGLYYAIVGFYFLIFAYFLLMRYRVSKKLFWLYFSVLFLFLAAGRGFFIVYYFYAPELFGTMSNLELVGIMMLLYRLATFSTWMGIACLMGVFGTLIFPPITEMGASSDKTDIKAKIKKILKNKNLRFLLKMCLIAIPIIVAILALTLPDAVLMDPDIRDQYVPSFQLVTIFDWYPAGRAVINFILLPLMVFLIPFIFVYLALKTFGVLRRSYALNAIGFFIYFFGRIIQGLLETFGFPHVRAILPPLLILLSLLIIVIANNYEQLR
ncbi:MAG: hypothetical protein HWN79_03515 [Candidatus Lokiarchaeota archaeon]|nr:hypothetical protein [Candidatus Lokiarchaeota archaeon]